MRFRVVYSSRASSGGFVVKHRGEDDFFVMGECAHVLIVAGLPRAFFGCTQGKYPALETLQKSAFKEGCGWLSQGVPRDTLLIILGRV